MSEDRLQALEILIADQEKTIHELSDMVTDQWKAIDVLKAQVRHLTDRLKRTEERLPDGASTVTDERPPHY